MITTISSVNFDEGNTYWLRNLLIFIFRKTCGHFHGTNSDHKIPESEILNRYLGRFFFTIWKPTISRCSEPSRIFEIRSGRASNKGRKKNSYIVTRRAGKVSGRRISKFVVEISKYLINCVLLHKSNEKSLAGTIQPLIHACQKAFPNARTRSRWDARPLLVVDLVYVLHLLLFVYVFMT